MHVGCMSAGVSFMALLLQWKLAILRNVECVRDEERLRNGQASPHLSHHGQGIIQLCHSRIVTGSVGVVAVRSQHERPCNDAGETTVSYASNHLDS